MTKIPKMTSLVNPTNQFVPCWVASLYWDASLSSLHMLPWINFMHLFAPVSIFWILFLVVTDLCVLSCKLIQPLSFCHSFFTKLQQPKSLSFRFWNFLSFLYRSNFFLLDFLYGCFFLIQLIDIKLRMRMTSFVVISRFSLSLRILMSFHFVGLS